MRPPSSVIESGSAPALARPRFGVAPGLAVFIAAKLCGVALYITHFPRSGMLFYFVPDPWFLIQIARPTSRGLGPVVTHFKTTRREVWLTIDDGPDPATTPRLLDLLDAHQAKATFFLIGERALLHPELVREIARHGHTIANHTHTHPSSSFWRAGPARTRGEIDQCAAALTGAGVQVAPWFRPAAGIKNVFLHAVLRERGLRLVMWSARGYDRVKQPHVSLQHITRAVQPGAIILVHEGLRPGDNEEPVIAPLLLYLREERYRCIVPAAQDLGP